MPTLPLQVRCPQSSAPWEARPRADRRQDGVARLDCPSCGRTLVLDVAGPRPVLAGCPGGHELVARSSGVRPVRSPTL